MLLLTWHVNLLTTRSMHAINRHTHTHTHTHTCTHIHMLLPNSPKKDWKKNYQHHHHHHHRQNGRRNVTSKARQGQARQGKAHILNVLILYEENLYVGDNIIKKSNNPPATWTSWPQDRCIPSSERSMRVAVPVGGLLPHDCPIIRRQYWPAGWTPCDSWLTRAKSVAHPLGGLRNVPSHCCKRSLESGRNKSEIWMKKLVWVWFWLLLYAQTPKHIIRGGWSHHTDTSEPVDGNGAQNIITVQSRYEPAKSDWRIYEFFWAKTRKIMTDWRENCALVTLVTQVT
jgi:hypothetical protein